MRRGRAVTNADRTCSPTPLLEIMQSNMFKLNIRSSKYGSPSTNM